MRVRLSVVIPTIKGREKSLAEVVNAYWESAPDAEIVIVRDEPSWGHACNAGYRESRGDIIHFGADDLEPLPGWMDDVIPALLKFDELPAARVLNHSADGPMDNAGDGADRAFVHFTRVPILTRDQYERIGPWPEYNYVADVWLSLKARTLGIPTRIYYSYAFVHHWSQIGRTDSQAEQDYAAAVLRDLEANLT